MHPIYYLDASLQSRQVVTCSPFGVRMSQARYTTESMVIYRAAVRFLLAYTYYKKNPKNSRLNIESRALLWKIESLLISVLLKTAAKQSGA